VKYLPFLAAAILATLGTLHLIYTIRDFALGPRYFAPRDHLLLERMRATHLALAPNGHDFWTTLVGFHFSHSIGVLLFALLIVIASLHQIDWPKLLLVGVGVAFTWVAWRCWFHIPLIGCATATALMAAGWIPLKWP
jgi:hypothetical protein